MKHTERRFDALPDIAPLIRRLSTGACLIGDVDDQIILYGRGNLGKLAEDFFTRIGKTPILTIDQHTELGPIGSTMRHLLPVAVAIANYPYVAIERDLEKNGFGNVVPFYDLTENYHSVHPVTNGWVSQRLTDEDTYNLTEVLLGWGDDCSRAHHLQFLAWHCLREEWLFDNAPVNVNERYFIPEVCDVLKNNEYFVDCGAHHGEVLRQFLEAVDGYKHVVAIEPDRNNMRVLLDKVPEADVFDYALDAQHGVAHFAEGFGYCSRIWPHGKDLVVTSPLDALDLEPSYVKLHLEGNELPALRGGMRTLVKHRPIIAATVYHNDDGIWRTAHWLMDMFDDYRFLFRLHGYVGTGAVIYAIPNERQ